MKKFIVLIVFLLVIVPSNVYAEKASTKIIGNEKALPGSNVVYTVIVDQPLTKYNAEISYDRTLLNLVSVEEININTTTKTFDVDKQNPIKISINSDNSANIIYKLTFNVKNSAKISDTNIELKTTMAVNNEDEFVTSDELLSLSIVEKDDLFVKDEDQSYDKSENKALALLNNVKVIIKNYGSPIMYASLALNLILLIALISNIRRKRVDYDF